MNQAKWFHSKPWGSASTFPPHGLAQNHSEAQTNSCPQWFRECSLSWLTVKQIWYICTPNYEKYLTCGKNQVIGHRTALTENTAFRGRFTPIVLIIPLRTRTDSLIRAWYFDIQIFQNSIATSLAKTISMATVSVAVGNPYLTAFFILCWRVCNYETFGPLDFNFYDTMNIVSTGPT